LVMLLDQKLIDGVVQVGPAPGNPIENSIYVHANSNRVQYLAGSRYSPSAPLAGIRGLLEGSMRYAFVGKPCDVAALRGLLNKRSQWSSRMPYLLSFFCAGIPSLRGTKAVISALGIQEQEVVSLRYRGEGWPGKLQVTTRSGRVATMEYKDSWGSILNRYIHRRCKLCADGTGEAADIVCADAWLESDDGFPKFADAPGRSLVLARTNAGLHLARIAEAQEALSTEPFELSSVAQIQPYQAHRKQSMLARMAAVRLTLGSAPRFPKYALFENARAAGPRKFFRAFFGAFLRRLRGRL
jgi:coenzyme F420 hydrogenase subunit beta